MRRCKWQSRLRLWLFCEVIYGRELLHTVRCPSIFCGSAGEIHYTSPVPINWLTLPSIQVGNIFKPGSCNQRELLRRAVFYLAIYSFHSNDTECLNHNLVRCKRVFHISIKYYWQDFCKYGNLTTYKKSLRVFYVKPNCDLYLLCLSGHVWLEHIPSTKLLTTKVVGLNGSFYYGTQLMVQVGLGIFQNYIRSRSIPTVRAEHIGVFRSILPA
jgi:hypothetical protein